MCEGTTQNSLNRSQAYMYCENSICDILSKHARGSFDRELSAKGNMAAINIKTKDAYENLRIEIALKVWLK